MIRKARKRPDPRLWEWPDGPEEDSLTYLKSYQSRKKISNPLPGEVFSDRSRTGIANFRKKTIGSKLLAIGDPA
jgi:hypothetical protein